MVRAPAPRHRIEVAICASGNFWLGVLGCQDLSPSIGEQILISLKLLLLFLKAIFHRRGLPRLRRGHVIIILRLSICRSLKRAGSPVFPFDLFESWLDGVFVVFGVIVYVVNILGVVIKCFGRILDCYYEVGGGWEAKFSIVNP